jgi:hypothetical protein
MIRNEQMYTTEFERIVLSEIEKLANSLPAGVAKSYFGPSRDDPKMIAPTFEIQPANPDAARIAGAIVEGEGATISVGHSRRQLWYKRTTACEASDCARRVSDICRAVFSGNFTEQIRVDQAGRRISSCLKLCLGDGTTFRMWHNRLFTDLFKVTTKRDTRYSPY